MGGLGSGRWGGHRRQSSVEETPCLDLSDSQWKEALRLPRTSGAAVLTVTGTGMPARSIEFELGPTGPDGSRRLALDFCDSIGSNQVVTLKRVRAGFTSRWLALCPRFCRRRVRKLYFVPVRPEVACWRCAGVTYRSAQQHDRRVDLARRDLPGFQEARSRAPRTLRSKLATASLISQALLNPPDRAFRGRGWGAKSTTWANRLFAQWSLDYTRRWGFPPEMSEKVAEWEAAGKPEPFEFGPEEGGRRNASQAVSGTSPRAEGRSRE